MHGHESGGGTIFNYNSDFSGMVKIVRPSDEGHRRTDIEIPGNDILEFVAYCKIMPDRIAAIEDADWKRLLSM